MNVTWKCSGLSLQRDICYQSIMRNRDCYIMTGNSNTTINFEHHIHAYRTEASNLNILQLKFNLANEIIAILMGGMFN